MGFGGMGHTNTQNISTAEALTLAAILQTLYEFEADDYTSLK